MRRFNDGRGQRLKSLRTEGRKMVKPNSAWYKKYLASLPYEDAIDKFLNRLNEMVQNLGIRKIINDAGEKGIKASRYLDDAFQLKKCYGA